MSPNKCDASTSLTLTGVAGATRIEPDDLAGENWISVINRVNALKHDDFIAACARAGFTPKVTMEATESQAARGLVAAGLGMTLIQRSLRYQAPRGVVLHELPWFEYRAPLWVAWHKVNLRPLVEIFRRTLLETSGVPTPDRQSP